MPAMFEGFENLRLARDGVALNVRCAGQGAPLLLLHGHPQTHAMWHRVAPQLAGRFRVVLVDLRGYGDSGRPPAGEQSGAYAKREMALDALHVMRSLSHERFQVLAHDRGARVAHRLAADHPQAVQRLMLLGGEPFEEDLGVQAAEVTADVIAVLVHVQGQCRVAGIVVEHRPLRLQAAVGGSPAGWFEDVVYEAKARRCLIQNADTRRPAAASAARTTP